jgi:hypothetical protein
MRAASSDDRSQSVPAGRVLAAGLLGLVLAGLLNADALLRDAKAKELGSAGRAVSVALWTPLQALSEVLQLNEPRQWADEALGRDLDETEFELPPVTVVSRQGPSGELATEQDGPTWRTPTADAPLRLWVGGDSMSQVLGESVSRLAGAFEIVDTEQDSRVSTGLSRPDYFDWPAHLDEVLQHSDPDVVVVMFGANDAQGLEADDGVHGFGEPGWVREYRRRVAGTMELLTADPDRLVVWVGQPSARDAEFGDRMRRINEIYAAEAEGRPNLVFVDTWTMFNDAQGGFTDVLPNASGDLVDMRQGDGFHFTVPGGDRLAVAALREVTSRFDLTAGRSAGSDPTG